MSEKKIYKVGLLHDPRPDDQSFTNGSAAATAARSLAKQDEKSVVAIWCDADPICIMTAGHVFKKQ